MKLHCLLSILCVVLVGTPALVNGQQRSKEELAQYYYNNGEMEQAIELFEPLYKKTSNKYYYQMLYRAYMNIGNHHQAEKLVRERMKGNQKDLYLYVDLGCVHAAKGEEKKARKTYEEAIERLTYDQKQVSDLVEAFVSIAKYDEATKCYVKARNIANNPYLYINELTAVYATMGNYEAVADEYLGLLDRSPKSINSIQVSLQRYLQQTSDNRLADGLRKALMARVQKDPGNETYLEMMIWFSLQEKDFEFALTQAKAVESRFKENGGEMVMRVAKIAQRNGEYDVADNGYKYIMKRGEQHPLYFEAKVGELEVRFDRLDRNYKLSTKEYGALKRDYEQTLAQLGKNQETVGLMRNYAKLTAYYGNEVQAAADMLYDALEIPKLSNSLVSEIKLELGDLLLFAGEVWDASLLYMQVEKAYKNDVLGAQAKLRNARLSYYTHDFEWAKSQLDVLRGATSKLVANDAMRLSLLISDNMEEDSTYGMLELFASADLLLYRNQLEAAWEAYDDISHRALSHSLFDEVLMQKAKIRMKQGRFVEADSLLQKVVDFYPEDILADDALYMSAQLNEAQLNNRDRARQQYEKLILDYPTSLYVDIARKRYNSLK